MSARPSPKRTRRPRAAVIPKFDGARPSQLSEIVAAKPFQKLPKSRYRLMSNVGPVERVCESIMFGCSLQIVWHDHHVNRSSCHSALLLRVLALFPAGGAELFPYNGFLNDESFPNRCLASWKFGPYWNWLTVSANIWRKRFRSCGERFSFCGYFRMNIFEWILWELFTSVHRRRSRGWGTRLP